MPATSAPTHMLRQHTAALHRRAETTGVVRAMISGRITRPQYVLYLQSLLPVYVALESHLDGPLREPALFRAHALRLDLEALGSGPEAVLPEAVLPEARAYEQRVHAAALGGAARLAAHAYTRYLGDLMGGQVLAATVAKALELGPTCLHFYRFPGLEPRAFAAAYRAVLDAAILPEHLDAALEEAAAAFELNTALSIAVERF